MKKKSFTGIATYAFLFFELLIYVTFLSFDLWMDRDTTWLKYGGILLCLAYGAMCALTGGDRLVLPALALTAGADALLLVLDRCYWVGILLFLAVQALYFIRLRRLGANSVPWLRTALPLLIGLALSSLGLATSLNLLAGLYFSQLLCNAILAWSVKGNTLFAVGLTLFVGCDVCVGLFNLGVGGFAPVGMWLFYLPSQVLIALSAMKGAAHEIQ